MFNDSDGHNVKISLTSALERPNACICTLVRTETGLGVLVDDQWVDQYVGFVGKDGWTEAAALGFGLIFIDAVNPTADPKIQAALISAVLDRDDAENAGATGVSDHGDFDDGGGGNSARAGSAAAPGGRGAAAAR